MSSRKGQPIARQACDACRDRKIKCTWTDAAACDGCVTAAIFCTFQTTRKRRGRPQRDLESFRQPRERSLPTHHPDGGLHTQPLTSAICSVAIEHLCPIDVFHTIIEDFLKDLYPIVPLIHIPSFTSQVREGLYTTNVNFLQFCLALCAMTISSLPGKSTVYCFRYYHDTKDMVYRAYQLVMASRLATSVDLAENASSNDMICSLLLGMASHYTQCPKRGWVLINESIHCCRSLNLHHQHGYEYLSLKDSEISKRAFWMLFIVQVHDRLTHRDPYTLYGESPSPTDWDFIIPLTISDEELTAGTNESFDRTGNLPVISGFITLIKTFLCVLGILDTHPPSPLIIRHQPDNDFLSPASLLRTFNALSHILDDLPPELDIVQTRPALDQKTRATHHFNVMKSNIHITKLYLQSWIVDRYLILLPPPTSPQSPRSALTESQRLRSYRQDIARQALQVLNFCSQGALESHGESMVIKIRQIATSLLEQEQVAEASSEWDEVADIGSDGVMGGQDHVLHSFLKILVSLDYANRQVSAG